MYNDNSVAEKVKSKEYILYKRPDYSEPIPQYIENPFAPPGHEIEVVWEVPGKPSKPSSFQPQVTEGGYSSKKLYRCGDVWYLKEYFDVNGEPFRFRYGPKESRDGLSEKVQAAIQKAEMFNVTAKLPEYADGDPVLQQACENVPEPGQREWTEEEKQEKRKINRSHAKETLRMLCNLNNLHYMYTFTFAPELHENVKGLRFILPLEKQRDRGEIEKVWNSRRSAIARWCKKNEREFKYVKVLEQHLGNKAEEETVKVGTYHIHLATDKPIDKHVLQHLWGYGVVWIDDFSKGRKAGAQGKDDPGRKTAVVDPGVYMSKYMEKDFDDAELHGYRAYSPSNNLKRPQPIRDEEEVEQLLQESNAEEHTVFDVTFDTEYHIFRTGADPELVKLSIRSRIFNFRRAQFSQAWKSSGAT